VSAIQYQDEPRIELDSHADTCCDGNNTLIIYYHNCTVSVAPFMDFFGTANDIPIVTAAIAYDDPILAQTFVLNLHQALYFGDQLFHNLISPFQLRLSEVTINERVRILTHQPTHDNHCILFDQAQVKIPLRLNGIVSYFSSRRPTLKEYHN
jgi:hypothetical protein